jgi:acetyl esterase/lipase
MMSVTSSVASQPMALWPGEFQPDAPVGQYASIVPYLVECDAPRPAVLVLPGGGYGQLAPHEGRDIALRLNREGFHAVVLNYRLGSAGHHHPAMIHDAQRAMRLVRSHAEVWRILPEAIAVLGFSAGGHLASTLAVHHGTFRCDGDDLADRFDARPNAAVLCYAVIDMAGVPSHGGSRSNLLGPRVEDTALRELLSNHRHVNAQTPPTFLWHTADDPAVPLANALQFTAACHDAGVPVELHVYESGVHGLGLALPPRECDPTIAGWMDLCAAFLRRHLR